MLKKDIFVSFLKVQYVQDDRLLLGVGIGVTVVIGVWILVLLSSTCVVDGVLWGSAFALGLM